LSHGFTITSDGTGGMPTAFLAEFGSGEPVVAILGEYDALPSLGNNPVPRQEPRDDGQINGHGCGHNLIASGSVGAAIALRYWLEQTGAPGTIRYAGCPAEETDNGKVPMALAGAFDGLAAAIHWHPGDRAVVANIKTAAVVSLRVEFHGRTAHAGAEPWMGRSALHALELFAHGVNLMREHMRPTSRMHYIFNDTGTAPNVIPDLASAQILYRDADAALVRTGEAWIVEIANAAAMATQTTVKVTHEGGANDLMPNGPLAIRSQAVLDAVGVPAWTDDEQAFAREGQKNAGLPTEGMSTTVTPLMPEITLGASTDVGDVSKITPTMGFSMPTVPLGVSMHTWLATASHGTSIGHKGAIYVALALAALGAEILMDENLRNEARADFEKRMDGKPYTPLAPAAS
jgi:aminobenzoyl-glutamate utilization protein B